jgi:hypothetical protein
VEYANGSVDSDDVRLTRLGEDTVTWYWQKFGTVWSSILEERSNRY